MKEDKEYYAFISYKREDKKEAKRLQHALEYYRLPSHLRQENPELPEYVRPVFRDMTDLEVGELSAQIHSALHQSHFLIVVCSPRAAASKWVNDEVEYFISLGKQDKIIPYIIEGVPHASNPNEECYPPSLLNLSKEEELLGANISEVGKDSATIRVVSRMFNIRFDTLFQRYEREQKRKRWMMIGGSLLFAFVSLIIGSYIAWQNRELDAKNKEVVEKRDRANYERDRANSERIRAEAANDSLIKANDNIERQYALIEQQKDEIAEERDNVKSANYKMQVNLSRILAEKANQLIDEGDSYLARLIALEALPPKLPYTPEAEGAIRKANTYENAILYGHQSRVNSAMFSPNGAHIVSSSNDNTLRIWDAETGSCTDTLEGHRNWVMYATYSHDGKKIVSASLDKTAKIWDSKTGVCLNTLKHTSFVDFATFSPDDTHIISAGMTNPLRIWDTRTGLCIDSLYGHVNPINHAAFSPDGNRIVSASSDKTIRIWDVHTKLCIDTLEGHTDNVNYAAFSPDGNRIVSASSDKTIRIWDVHTGLCIDTLEGHTDNVNYAAFSPDGKYIASCSSKISSFDAKTINENISVRIWNVSNGECIRHIKIGARIKSISYSPNGQLLIISFIDGTIRLVDLNSNNRISTFKSYGMVSKVLCISGDSTIISEGGRLYLHIDGKESRCFLEEHSKLINSAAFSTDKKYFVTASNDKTIRIWDTQTGVCLDTLIGHKSQVNYAAFSPDGMRIISASSDNTIRTWNVKTGACINILKVNTEFVKFISFCPNGKHIAFANGNGQNIQIWDIKRKMHIKTLTGHTDKINSASFSPNGKMIATTSDDKTIRIWNAESGSCLHTLEGFTDFVTTAIFDIEGKNIISGCYDGSIYIWDAGKGICIDKWNIPPLNDRYQSVKIISTSHKNYNHIIIGCVEYLGVMSSWNLYTYKWSSLRELIEKTQKRIYNRRLTPEERRKYYID